MFTVEELEKILASKEFRETLLDITNKEYILEIEEANQKWKVDESEVQNFINKLTSN